jgi:hypothetical protein
MASDRTIAPNSTDVFLTVAMRSSTTGQLVTGIAFGTPTVKYQRDGAATAITVTLVEGTLGTHIDSSWIETQIAGVYQLCLADAAFAAGVSGVEIVVTSTGCIDKKISVQLASVPADMRQIMGDGLDGNNATLNLKQLSIVNNAGVAVDIQATGGEGSEGAAVSLVSESGVSIEAFDGTTGVAPTVGEIRTEMEKAGTTLATLLSRITAQVATQADVAAITQAQRVRIAAPSLLERPDAGSTTYRIWIYAYDAQHQAEDLDAVPTVGVENNTGTDRSSGLSAVTKQAASTGIYYVDYTVASDHAVEGLLWRVTATEGGTATQYAAASIVVDTTAVDFTSADRGKLDTLAARILGTLDAGTHKPQTGDAYARLGAPAGASTAADIAAVLAAIAALNDYDGSDPAGVTTLLERLTALRSGYLDKLNVPGTLANTDNAASFKADVSALATAAAVDGLPAAVLAAQVDSLAVSKILQAVAAVLFGKATVSGSTVSFKGRDGATTVVSVTVGETEGERTASVVS